MSGVSGGLGLAGKPAGQAVSARLWAELCPAFDPQPSFVQLVRIGSHQVINPLPTCIGMRSTGSEPQLMVHAAAATVCEAIFAEQSINQAGAPAVRRARFGTQTARSSPLLVSPRARPQGEAQDPLAVPDSSA